MKQLHFSHFRRQGQTPDSDVMKAAAGLRNQDVLEVLSHVTTCCRPGWNLLLVRCNRVLNSTPCPFFSILLTHLTHHFRLWWILWRISFISFVSLKNVALNPALLTTNEVPDVLGAWGRAGQTRSTLSGELERSWCQTGSVSLPL